LGHQKNEPPLDEGRPAEEVDIKLKHILSQAIKSARVFLFRFWI